MHEDRRENEGSMTGVLPGAAGRTSRARPRGQEARFPPATRFTRVAPPRTELASLEASATCSDGVRARAGSRAVRAVVTGGLWPRAGRSPARSMPCTRRVPRHGVRRGACPPGPPAHASDLPVAVDGSLEPLVAIGFKARELTARSSNAPLSRAGHRVRHLRPGAGVGAHRGRGPAACCRCRSKSSGLRGGGVDVPFGRATSREPPPEPPPLGPAEAVGQASRDARVAARPIRGALSGGGQTT